MINGLGAEPLHAHLSEVEAAAVKELLLLNRGGHLAEEVVVWGGGEESKAVNAQVTQRSCSQSPELLKH
jgi:hypothetical protein